MKKTEDITGDRNYRVDYMVGLVGVITMLIQRFKPTDEGWILHLTME